MSFALLSLILLSLLHQACCYVSTSDTVVNEPVAAAWYADWHADKGFPLSSVSWAKYNTLIYSFAVTTPNVNNLSFDVSDPSLLRNFVTQAHQHNVSAHLAIGGWGGGLYFSSDVATPENRTAFVRTIVDLAKRYNLDGLQMDWEYPGKPGVGCNTKSANDTANLLSFLQELRKDPVGSKLILSAATPITPFIDATGQPSTNMSAFAEVLDYISIMNYDVWGSWSSTVGPNSPLKDSCSPPAYQQGSAESAVKAWTTAGVPGDQIVIGVAAYGHSFSVSPSDAFSNSSGKLVSHPKFNSSNQPLGGPWDDKPSVDACGVKQGPGGTFTLWALVDGGFLTKEGKPAPGISFRFDECTKTPYVYNKTSEVMISYQDTRSFAATGDFIKKRGLRGFSMWEAGGDYHDLLLDSIKSHMEC